MLRFPCLVAAVALSAACASQQTWWQQDLQEWEGAPVTELLDAWGPPLRTQTSEDESAVLVYERIRQLDHRLEELRDPAARLMGEYPEGHYSPVDRSECVLYVEVVDEHVAGIRREGGSCEVVPRDPARRQPQPETRQR
jgi:hypothetical protein